jgi:lipopolysaccharide transport system ATP-binding protein
VERFLDTPLKRYSSGMKVRLAFAVAAHLEPEILIVDEVLAVGDVEFQAKCLGKMGEVARGGRTVILVSHSMGAITNLCRSVMWFDQGRLLRQGTSRDIVRDYLQSNTGHSQGDASLWRHEGVGGARIQRIEVLNARGLPCDAFPMGETVLFEFDVDFMETFTAVDMSVVIRRPELGMNILCAYSKDAGFSIDRTEPGTRRFRIEIPECNLYPSSYSVSVFVGVGGVTVLDSVADVLRFSTVQSGITGRTTRLDNDEAVYYAQSRWSELEALETQDEGALANG